MKVSVTIIGLFIALLTTFIAHAAGDAKPNPVPASVRVISSEPRKVVWAGLTKNEQKLATHLLNASLAARDIIYNQNHRHALLIKCMLESALSARNLQKTKAYLGDEAFNEFVNYSAKFEDLMGPYTVSNRKYILTKVTAQELAVLFKKHSNKYSEADRNEAVRLLTDASYEVISQPEDSSGTDLENSGGNMYEHGLTGAEVAQAIKDGLNSNLNCRIIRGENGKPTCEVQALNNPKLPKIVKNALKNVVSELNKALPYALTEHQRNQLMYLVKYLREGDTEDFRKMNIEWVRDATNSKVDFMMGWVEVYADYLNQIGSWESYVQVVDPTTTTISVNLAKNAQTFENAMPYGKYKKTFPENYSPPALMVYYFRETSSFHSGGYNLPNYDDIRRDVGAKNIIRLDLPGQDKDENTSKLRLEAYSEFIAPDKAKQAVQDFNKWRRTLVLLHEIIGHGSGTYDTSKYGEKEDPIGALGSLGSALEEQRADQTALVFGADPILVKVGLFENQEEANRVRNSMYDAYLASFLVSTSVQRSLTEAHQRGHWLLINKLMKAGAVKMTAPDGSDRYNDDTFVLSVVDYDLFYKVSHDLLAELQRIKAERDETELKRLFEEEAPLNEIEKPWLQAVINRGKKLSINNGAIEQPWRVHRGEVETFGGSTVESIAPFYSKP